MFSLTSLNQDFMKSIISSLEELSSLDREAGALEALCVVLSFADILRERQA
jgi:hypothetical protein